ERLKKGWNPPVYAFYEPTPSIEYSDGWYSHVFKCMVKSCKQQVQRYLDKGDTKSTSNMAKHVKCCWGAEAYEAVQEAKSATAAREGVITNLLKTGTITSSFKIKSKGKVTYSHRQHTKTETKAEIMHWVSESFRPFKTVNDRGFQSLMKTGHLEYYLPSLSTVSCNMKLVFANVQQWIAQMLQVMYAIIKFA
ncbi:uncharacterized protein EDB91DRAFT_1045322, partial [Suillus paluster]|uniref:uncharacterized protein n=1 Tax=Suillus paluster TaxID=48578 RepID=UPI001B88290F